MPECRISRLCCQVDPLHRINIQQLRLWGVNSILLREGGLQLKYADTLADIPRIAFEPNGLVDLVDVDILPWLSGPDTARLK